MDHTRYFCQSCRRQWVEALGWTFGEPCPVCTGTYVHTVTYRPGFPGGDYDPEAAAAPGAVIYTFPTASPAPLRADPYAPDAFGERL